MNDIQVFSKEWFAKYQKPILWFANTLVGRYFFRINRDVPKNKKLVAVYPNAVVWHHDAVRMAADIRTHDKFAKRLYYGLKPLWLILHGWDFVFGQQARQLNFGFDSLLKYPAAGAVSPVDGIVTRSPVTETFTTIRAGAGTSKAVSDTQQGLAFLRASTTVNQFDEYSVGIFLFDTSAIGAASTVDGAVISFNGDGVATVINLGTTDVHVAAATTASNSDLATADYQARGHVSFASMALASYSTSGYNDFLLNTLGLANISKTGISKFSTQLGWDIDNSFGGTWSSGNVTTCTAYFADRTGTAQDPKLLVVFTTGSTPQLIQDVRFDNNWLSSVPGLRVLATDADKPPKRKVNIYNIVKSSKSKATSAFYTEKTIVVKVDIVAATRALAEQAQGRLMGLLHGLERPLLVNQAGILRTYYATLVDTVPVERGGAYVELNLVFACSDVYGYDAAITNLELTTAASQYIYFYGSAETQAPIITITYTALSGGTAKDVVVGNGSSGQRVTINRNWAAGDVLQIGALDANRNRTVKVNGVEVAYTGAMPEWSSGLGTLTYSDTLSSKTMIGNVTYNPRHV